MRCVAVNGHTRDIVQHICAKLQSSSDSHCGSNFMTERTLEKKKKIALIICVCEMNPINDIVCSLFETPFSRWKDDDKRNVFTIGQSISPLNLNTGAFRLGLSVACSTAAGDGNR